MDRAAWRATVHRAAKSQTRLKRLSTHAHTSSFYRKEDNFSILPHKKDWGQESGESLLV